MHELGDSSYNREVNTHHRRGSQRVNHAPLENQVYVHQAVTEDRVAERQWQQAQ